MDIQTALKTAAEAFANDDAELAKDVGKLKAELAGVLNTKDAAALDRILGHAQERSAATRSLANAITAPGFTAALGKEAPSGSKPTAHEPPTHPKTSTSR